jgi:hypothetical protein
MDKTLKKKIAREILLLFGIFGLIILIAFGIWCYLLVINKQIIHRTSSINYDKGVLTEISNAYNSKFSKIKSFITILKTKEDEKWGSNYSLYLASKELKIDKAIKKYEDEQSFNGKLPNPKDTVSYIACIRQISTADKWSKYIVYTDDDILSVWNCLSTKMENLYYLLPMQVLEEFKIDNKTDLINLFHQYSFTKDELKSKTQKTELETKIKQLEQERSVLYYKVITRDDLLRMVKITFIIILIIAYPARLLFLTFKWAIKTYRQ